MSPAILAGLTGVMQGARHALEPDHVTAVATVMVEAPSPRRGMFYAACWGLGHASMLLIVGGALVIMRVDVPASLAIALELVVAAMLIYLGVRTLREAHAPSAAPHTHAHAHAHALSPLVRGRRPFLIGIVHGLAGSGALAALIALGSPTMAAGLACLALYAIGTVIGMVALAALAGPALGRAGRFPLIANKVSYVAGVVSIGVGLVWAVTTISTI